MFSFSPRYVQYQFTVHTLLLPMCTHTNVPVVNGRFIVVVYDKTWENQVMLSLHGQLALDIRPQCF